MDVKTILFRASGVGKIMVSPQNKSELIAKTVQTHLIDIYASWKYGRREEIDSKFLTKGNDREKTSIKLLSDVTKKLYIKNKQRLNNEYFTGEWDLHDSVKKITHTTDIKSCWSLHTFLRNKYDKLNKDYYYQGMTYMDLTGAEKHTIAFCLVNSTADAIDSEKRFLSYKKGMIDTNGNESPEYVKKCQQIEINHIFDIEAFKREYPYYSFHNDLDLWKYDIPEKDRVHTVEIKRDNNIIDKMKLNVTNCREWIKTNLDLV